MSTTAKVQLPVTVLIADDDASIRFVLKHLLETEGYTVEEAEDGNEAIEMIQQNKPDMVLLDAVMPGYDGFQICSWLQTTAGYDRIPVLMVTGLDDEESVNRAFAVGAVDYVTKPLQWPVLRQRVRRLIANNQVEKMRDDLTQMIVHDMKNPLSTIRGFAEMLIAEPDMLDPVTLDCLRRIYHGSNNLIDMTMMILDLGRLEEGRLIPSPYTHKVASILYDVRDSFEWMSANYGVRVEVGECQPDLAFTLDWNLIQRVIANLLSNAIKHSPTNGTVTLSCDYVETPEPALHLSVTDEGEGIPEQDQKRIFDKFTQALGRKRGSRNDTGLGLTFCKLATETNGGRIELESEVDRGSTFTLIFPGQAEFISEEEEEQPADKVSDSPAESH